MGKATENHPAYDPLLNEQQAADYTGLSVHTLRTKRCRGGGPPFVKMGRSVRYKLSDLNAWIEARTVANTSEDVDAA